jgi:hypothetical protein
MKPVARIYKSEEQARDAVGQLRDAGYAEDTIFLMTPPKAAAPAAAEGEEGEEAAPAKAAPAGPAMSADELTAAVSAAGDLSSTQALVYARALAEGHCVLVVGAPYGYNARAAAIMDGCGAVDAGGVDTAKPDNPSPFSDLIGMPCLEHRLSFFSGDNPLIDSNWTLFPVNLKDTLTTSPQLIDNPTWLSSKIGFKALSKERPWKTSFGFKLLTNQQD